MDIKQTQSIQSLNSHINQPTIQPTIQSTTQPTVQSTIQPTIQTAQLINKSINVNRLCLDKRFYTSNYNIIRRSKIMILAEILEQHEQYKKFTTEEKYCFIQSIEQSCIDFCIAETINDYCNWCDFVFNELYHSIMYRVISNLEVDGMVKNNSYFADNIFNHK